MSAPQVSSSFLTACVIPPRDPKTNLPTSLLERESYDLGNTSTSPTHYSKRHPTGSRRNSSEKVISTYEPNSNSVNKHDNKRSSKNTRYSTRRDSCEDSTEENPVKEHLQYNSLASMETTDQSVGGRYVSTSHDIDLQSIINNDDKFLSHLEALKAENKKTLNSLEKFYTLSLDHSKQNDKNIFFRRSRRTSKTPTREPTAKHNNKLKDHYKSIEMYTENSTDQVLNTTKKNKKTKNKKDKPSREFSFHDERKDHVKEDNSECENENTKKKDIEKTKKKKKDKDKDKNRNKKDNTKKSDKKSKKKSKQKKSKKSSTSSSSSSLSSSSSSSSTTPSTSRSSSKNKENKILTKEGWKTPELNQSIVAFNRTLEKAMTPVDSIATENHLNDEKEAKFVDDLTSEDELDEQLKVKVPENHVIILPDTSSFRGRSSSFDVIANMWENFSVDEYAPYAPRARPNPTDEKVWSPNVTIPEPFKMTLRDEAKAKTKSKRIEKIEQEKLDKRLQEEAELHKRAHPTPVPPTTFLPLYNELREENERRRRYIRDLSKQILKSSEKPFSFMQREKTKTDMKRSRSMNNMKVSQKLQKNRRQFKANPFPEKLFDLTLADKIAEQEEFRKIKIKLRSQEMLANSSLPLSMKTRSNLSKHYPKREKTRRMMKELERRKQSSSFTPQIHHDIPDFEELQKKFERELEQKKNVNTPTVCEPFNLHTEKIPKRRSKFLETVLAKKENNQQLEGSSSYSFNNSSRHFRRPATTSSSCTDTRQSRSIERRQDSKNRSSSLNLTRTEKSPIYSHTETSRRREERLRQSLNKTKEEELRQNIQLNKKRKELEYLRRSVTKKAHAQDPARNRGRETREKMKSFKEADHARRKEYQEYLDDVNDKLKTRPLLFEREAQTNARRKAQRRYEEILKDAGIEGNTLDSFLQEPYKNSTGDHNSNQTDTDDYTKNTASDDDDGDDGSYTQQQQQKSEQYSDEYESDGRDKRSDGCDSIATEGTTESGEEYELEEESDNDGSYVPESGRKYSSQYQDD